MSIAHPAALFGLLLLPLIAILYMWRARHQRQVVSSTWLWAEAQARFSHQPSRRMPLREPLLILQLLAALALTLLLAGPAFSRPVRVHQIVVLDASMTMAAADARPSRWSEALEQVRALLNARPGDTTISLILAGARAQLLGEAPGDADLTRILDRLPPPSGVADLTSAAALAQGLATGTGAPRVLFLAGAQTPTLPLTTLPVQTRRLGGALDDQNIAGLTIRCIDSGSACQAFARLRNTAGVARDDVIAVWADGRSLGQQAIRIPAAGALDLDFAVPSGARVVRAALLRRDALPDDNVAWALVPSPSPTSVLLVSDAPGVVQAALQAIPGVSVQAVGTGAYQDTQAAGKDLVVMDGETPDFLPPVPALLLNPPSDTALFSVKAASTALPVTQVDASDPIVSGIDLYHLAISGESIVAPDWAHVAASGSRGPVVFHGLLDGQRVAVLPWDASHSPAAQDPVFPLLIERLVRWLAPVPAPAVSPGAVVTLPATVQSVRDPAGVTLTGPSVTANRAGVYRVAESIGAWQTGDPLFAVPGTNDVVAAPAATAPSWRAPRIQGALPYAVWPLILLAALIALGGEWVVYARKT
jgi:hypothetical protein